MADTLTTEQRSWNMSKIKNKDTTIEVSVRKYLFKNGFRYRNNVHQLPGTPDIVLKKYNTVIFVHGCFWHRHAGCSDATLPKTRTDFWANKLDSNVNRDRKSNELLQQLGWKVITIWECELKKNCFELTMQKVIDEIISPNSLDLSR